MGLNCGTLTPVAMSSGHDGCADGVLESLNVAALFTISIAGEKVSGQTGIELVWCGVGALYHLASVWWGARRGTAVMKAVGD